jgi:hypothetical protein
MMGFLDVARIEVPASVADDANSFLRAAGQQGYEAFSLWVGIREGSTFRVRQNIVPRQEGHRSESGVWVSVGSVELHNLNLWLYENEMLLVAQLHSHPTEAFHSELDDTFPIATTVGSLSIVIPDFARNRFQIERCAVFRLSRANRWEELSPSAVSSLIFMVD